MTVPLECKNNTLFSYTQNTDSGDIKSDEVRLRVSSSENKMQRTFVNVQQILHKYKIYIGTTHHRLYMQHYYTLRYRFHD